ncbi:MAG: threonine synthase [Ignavibacteria bacterium]|nr:threonine synthase [Ignavibacteria bacterium]
MKFYSTNNKQTHVSFREAVLKGIADDGGLFMPNEIPKLPESFFREIEKYSFQEIGYEVAKFFIDDIDEQDLRRIINQAVSFPAPLVPLSENISVLELFHGPTLAFKDFGAQFLANLIEHYLKDEEKETLILVATSGDTGSAVANGFYEKRGIKVALLYPGGKVSKTQEQQLTTLGKNIFAFEVEGVFDDCQQLVKQAFHDNELKNIFSMTSANSINIARLLPQSFYYFEAYKQIKDKSLPFVISVPSGNFGNLTAGLIAQAMGLPIEKFIAAVNANDIFPKYLENGEYKPKDSVQTISNAMDVGNPSNFARIISLFDNDVESIRNTISSSSYSDEQTLSAIKEVKEQFGYTIDPHGAVGYLALKKYLENCENKNVNAVILETAHPSKFSEIVDEVLNEKTKMPERLSACLVKEKKSVLTQKDYASFKEALIKTIT